jgi:exodeoxyribonuclease III
VRVIGGYFPNGQAPDSEKFVYKMRWQDALHDWLRSELQPPPATGADGRLQRGARRPRRLRPRGLGRADPLHARRARAVPAPAGAGPARRLPLFEQPPKSWSWWDYRNLAFRKNQGLRIDHILVSEALRAARARPA